VLRHVREASGNRSAAVALGVVAQLTARGVPSDAAGDAVVYLLKRGAGHGHLLRLQQEVQADLAIGMAASRSLDLRMRTLTTSLPPPVQPAAATADAEAGPQLMGGTPRTTPTTPRKKP